MECVHHSGKHKHLEPKSIRLTYASRFEDNSRQHVRDLMLVLRRAMRVVLFLSIRKNIIRILLQGEGVVVCPSRERLTGERRAARETKRRNQEEFRFLRAAGAPAPTGAGVHDFDGSLQATLNSLQVPRR